MDRVCITMPDDLREFLLAMTIAQDYQVQLVTGAQRKQRDANFEVTFRMDEKFVCFESCLRIVKENIPIFDYTGWREKQRGDYDCFIDFDFSIAEKISLVTKDHVTETFGNILGAGPQKWPALAPLQLKQPVQTVDVLVLPWGVEGCSKFAEFIENNYPQLTAVYDDRDLTSFEDRPAEFIDFINHFSIVIGPMSAATYVAATLKKSLIEVFPSQEKQTCYTNASAPVYSSVIGGVTAEFMWTVWEELWEKLQEHLSITRRGETIQTVQ